MNDHHMGLTPTLEKINEWPIRAMNTSTERKIPLVSVFSDPEWLVFSDQASSVTFINYLCFFILFYF